MSTTVMNLPLELIVTNVGQPRQTFYEESLQELATSIKERGVLEPIVVRPVLDSDGVTKYEIVMGERRFRASKIAGLLDIPAVIREMSDEDAQADALLENFQREDLNPVEKAKAIQGLLTFMSWEKCSKTLGVSETTLRRSLELLDLPIFVQTELVSRPGNGAATISEGHARILAVLNHDPGSQKRMVEKIKQERLNVGDTEKILQAILRHPDKKEAFLRVPLNITEQLLKALGVRAEKAKPYQPKTAEQHMSAIEKIGGQLNDLLDDRVVEFLTVEQMNQMLSTCAELYRGLEEFNKKLRGTLKTREVGFQETYIHCPLCGKVELVGCVRCSVCWSILRRCYDCGNYDRGQEKCGVTGAPIFVAEAENPREHSKSYKCSSYRPKYEAQAVKTLKVA